MDMKTLPVAVGWLMMIACNSSSTADAGGSDGGASDAGNEMADAGTDGVPGALDAIESWAEDAFDSAIAGDMATVRTQADALSAKWAAFRDQAVKDGAAQETIAAVGTAIDNLKSVAAGTPDAVSLARAANAISAPMEGLYAIYDPAVPAGVLTLDYLGREVLLDAMAGDFAGATAHVNSFESSWAALRDRVVEANGAAVADGVDASIAAEGAAITAASAAGLEAAANDQLEQVDAVEKVF